MKSFLLSTALAVLLGMSQSAIVEDKVRQELASQGTTSVLLHFKGPKSKEIVSDYQRIHRPQERSVHPDVLPSMLEENSNRQQAKTLNLLKERELSKTPGSDFFQLWAYNKIIVNNADSALIDELEKNDEIESITADEILDDDDDDSFDLEHTGPIFNDLSDETEPQWGVRDVQAPEAWERGFSGSGVTVGVIDTGVRASHELISPQFRKTFGWFDAVDGETTPYDNHSHGTHVAGIIAGSRGIGVAPNATIIACKSMKGKGLRRGNPALACGQFMLCPTDPTGKEKNCSARPKIINNSWSAGKNNHFFDEMIDLWLAQNQIPLFASGNYGLEGCGTTKSPGENPKVISVANIDRSNKVAETSSPGPASDGTMKPDIAAPGTDILSAYNTADTATMSLSGTSMATPHVAGVAAIFCSQNPDLTPKEFWQKLKAGAKPTVPTGESCGGVSDSEYPNNHVGYGKVQILPGLE